MPTKKPHNKKHRKRRSGTPARQNGGHASNTVTTVSRADENETNGASSKDSQPEQEPFASCVCGGFDTDSEPDSDEGDDNTSPMSTPTAEETHAQLCKCCEKNLINLQGFRCMYCPVLYCSMTCFKRDAHDHSKLCERIELFNIYKRDAQNVLQGRPRWSHCSISSFFSDVPGEWTSTLGGSKIILLLELCHPNKSTPRRMCVKDKTGKEEFINISRGLETCTLDTPDSKQPFQTCMSHAKFCVIFGAYRCFYQRENSFIITDNRMAMFLSDYGSCSYGDILVRMLLNGLLN